VTTQTTTSDMPTPSVDEWAEWAGISLEIAQEQYAAGAESWSATVDNRQAD